MTNVFSTVASLLLPESGESNMDDSSFFRHMVAMSPLRVELEITEACNLRCLFCYNNEVPVHLTYEQAREIIDRLVQESVFELVLTGGEPGYNSDFLKIVSYATGKIPVVLVQTNGTLFDAKTFQELRSREIAGMNISLHGEKDIHEKITRIPGSHDRAIESIRMCLANQICLWVNTVITKVNASNIIQHLTSLKNIGVENFTFTRFTPIGKGADVNIALSKEELISTLREIVCFSKENGVSVLLANAVPSCFLPVDLKFLSEICTFGLNKFYIDVFGNLLYCGMSRIKLGNIFTHSIKQIKEKSDIFNMNCNNRLCPVECQTCSSFGKNCRGGCRAAALADTGSLLGKDPLLQHI